MSTPTKPAPPSALRKSTNGVSRRTMQPAETETTTGSELEVVAEKTLPWAPANQVADQQGLSLVLFGPPGSGKSTLAGTAAKNDVSKELLLVNFDGELRSLSDRTDISVWPKDKAVQSTQQAAAFLSKLQRMKHPFQTIMFDTMNSAHKLAYKEELTKGGPNRDGRQVYGGANDWVLDIIYTWSMRARETGINVIFIMHSEEVKDGENGPIVLRPSVTPGVIKGMHQAVSAVGCLLEMPGTGHTRKLYLHNTAKISAKMHQPQSGQLLPLEIVNPDLGRMIEHVKGIRPYPTKEK